MSRWHAAMGMAALLVAFTVPALARHEPIVAVPREPDTAEVVVNGIVLLRLVGGDASARAAVIADRLRRLDFRRPPTVTIQDNRNSAVLMINGVSIVTIEPALAAHHHSTPAALASVWGDRLRQALAMHSIELTPAALSLVPGQWSRVLVHIFPPAPLTVGPIDRALVEVRQGTGGLVVFARAVGTTVIPLRAGAARYDLPVTIRPPAALLPPAAEVAVTGTPSDPELIREAIRLEVMRVSGARPGSIVDVAIGEPAVLAPGEEKTLDLPVSVRHPFAQNTAGVVRVTIRNIPVELQTPTRLLVSNRPETVLGNGVLFSESLRPGESTRLLYHHRNGAATARIITVTLSNPYPQMSRVVLIGAAAGPSLDFMGTGHLAAAKFLQRLHRQQGYIIEVPAGGTHTFTVHEMPPGALVSGLLQVQMVAGRGLELEVRIRSPWLLERTVTSAVNDPGHPHPHGTFAASEFSATRHARAGETTLVLELGIGVTPVDPTTGVRLTGDYGIVYRLVLDVQNLSDAEAKVALTALAAGGPARGVLLIDDHPIDMGLLRETEERRVASFTIPAWDLRTITILTMPAAGSFYPVRLFVRPDSPPP